MSLALYRFLTRILWLPVALYLLLRLKQGKEDGARFKERFGYSSCIRPKGMLIWVHAVSVGESISVLPLITQIVNNYPYVTVLLTTSTVTSARLIEDKLPKNTLHQYMPVDCYSSVRKFIRHWKPDLALWVESELWPNLLTEAARRCPVVMVNGRLSEKSFLFWHDYPRLRKVVIGSFSRCFMQSRGDKERLISMGATNVEYMGNLKYDAPPLVASPTLIEAMKQSIQDRVVWVAASTHEGEEEQVIEAHIKLKQDYPDLLTIIVPRHPVRAEQITALIVKKGLHHSVRSKDEAITADTEIYLADTMGELGLFFRMSRVVFVGASLVVRGGHNPLEPARMGCAVIMGPFGYNCVEICDTLRAKGALIIVQNSEEFYNALKDLLGNAEKQEYMAAMGLEVVKESSLVSAHYMDAIRPFIERRKKDA